MYEGKCLICTTRDERSAQSIFENEHWRASLSANQGYLGTLFVELLLHKESLPVLTDGEWLSFASLSREVEAAERQAFGAVTFNWTCIMNVFYKHVPPVPHVHWHVRPRYDQEVVVGHKVFADPDFGSHYQIAHLAHISPGLKEEIAGRLKEYSRS